MNRHSRSAGLLLEIIIAILFFSVICAITLRVFAKSREMSRDSLELAVTSAAAQSVAEKFRADHNYLEYVQPYASINEKHYYYYDQNMEPAIQQESAYIMQFILTAEESGGGTLYTAHITVSRGNVMPEAFMLAEPVCSYEVSKYIGEAAG